ncbi:MAG: ectonucleotide pyrophosphatase/phosphodiesterase [Treponema sp.]|jgi:predicted AlkP superfamily pyrophosphatase or phosphodiesterase|nr:ectonucleotide pyrophosphatase/phosphodiesterase [Treponema sp.]
MKTKLLIISFDAVGDRVFDRIARLPHTSAFLRSAALARDVSSIFLTNTYPIHSSVVTGLPQSEHGLISNTAAFPDRYPQWQYRSSLIKKKTLWQAAAEKGISVAAVLWPATGGAKEIRWNMPEMVPRPGDNQLLLNLKNGSKFLQMQLWLRHRKLLDGTGQPSLDRFSVSCMTDILRRHRPGLAFMHFTAYDGLCHKHGEDFTVLDKALKAMDEGLGNLLEAAGDETAVILFSDHAQLPISKTILPNDLLVEMGLLKQNNEGAYTLGESGCFIECCGGSAFIHGGSLEAGKIRDIQQKIEKSLGFNRWLRPEEMQESGRGTLPAGFCALPSFQYEAFDSGEKAQHGYPLDYDGYKVFYAARGPGVRAGARVSGGSLLDLAPLALRFLGEGLPPERAPHIPGMHGARKDFFA